MLPNTRKYCPNITNAIHGCVFAVMSNAIIDAKNQTKNKIPKNVSPTVYCFFSMPISSLCLSTFASSIVPYSFWKSIFFSCNKSRFPCVLVNQFTQRAASSQHSCSRAAVAALRNQRKTQLGTYCSHWVLFAFSLSSLLHDYSMMVATLPEPTVRPPSRIAKVRPCSIAIG